MLKKGALLGLVIALQVAAVPAQTAGVKISGRVTGIPTDAPSKWLRLTLTGSGLENEISVLPDGEFQFDNVPSGDAFVRLAPARAAQRFVVGNEDLEGLQIAINPSLFGKVEVDGGPLPEPADLMAGDIRIDAVDAKGKRIRQNFVRSDGVFGFFDFPDGDYTFRFSRLPRGYSVKAMTYGGKEYALGPIKVMGAAPSFLHILLTPDSSVRNTGAPSALVVSTRGRGPAYAEGALQFFEVRSTSGESYREQRRLGGEWYSEPGGFEPSGVNGGDSLSFLLRPGEFEVRSYVRPCDGNCSFLGAPTDECRASFTIKQGETLYAERFQSALRTTERRCRLVISTLPPQ